MSNLAETLERFRRGPELLAVVLTGVYGEETDFTTGPGKWSIRQIIAHLADSELVAAQRFRQVIAEDDPKLGAFDQEAWARNLDYARRQPKQLRAAPRTPRNRVRAQGNSFRARPADLAAAPRGLRRPRREPRPPIAGNS